MSVSQTKLNVLIVDDEKEACINLRNMLIEYIDPEISIVGIAYNTKEAEEKIKELNPDAVFLDIEMPNEKAFHFLNRIAPVTFEVVFVTAYDEYAIQAFKLNAVDYILKPISITELSNAVKKLKEKIYYKKIVAVSDTPLADMLKQISNKTKPHRLTLKDNNNVEVIDFKDICYIEAQGSYSRILFIKDSVVKEVTMSTSIAEYEELLPDDIFYRIHKSYLINCRHVKKILKDDSNHIVIRDEFTLPVSRRRYALLLEFLKSNKYADE
jgi:two-component system LytT family response regulator